MDKFFQILKLSLIVALLIIAPLLSSSLRSTCLYFIFNLLIIILGAEAGLISFFSKPHENKFHVALTLPRAEAGLVSFFSEPLENKNSIVTIPRASALPLEVSPAKEGPNSLRPLVTVKTLLSLDCHQEKATMRPVMEKSSSLKTVRSVGAIKVKKCPSTPSLFFIGEGEFDGKDMHEDINVEGEEIGIPSKQELFHKAETFIANFYKQLKMQREDSWKRIHGFYNKAF